MKIACVQFDSKLGEVSRNIARADALLTKAATEDLDLLILPEMAFTGYNFTDLPGIRPYLEPTSSGPSAEWGISTAQRLSCHVLVGYPETCITTGAHYNSAVLISPTGSILTNYRKTFLYKTDETWAQEGSGFFAGKIEGLGQIAIGICMDLNPYQFTAPFTAYEFARHCADTTADLILLPTAWLTLQSPDTVDASEYLNPDVETLQYWLLRLGPLVSSSPSPASQSQSNVPLRRRTFVTCNRTGIERDAVFAGTSSVVRISESGEYEEIRCLGRGEEGVLVCHV